MYVLYWAPGSAAFAPQALLEEIGAPYELRPVDISSGRPRDPDYLKLNPNGAVPALVHGETVMYESAALCLYLNERHPEAGMGPPPGDPARAHYFKWLLYFADTLQPAYQTHYYPERFCADPTARPAVQARAAARLDEIWTRIDGALGEGPWLLGSRFSICDIYMYMLTTWLAPGHRPVGTYANVARVAAQVTRRPAVRRILPMHGLALGTD